MKKCNKTDIELEIVTSGFLGYSKIYYLWKDRIVIATSLDGKNWTLGLTLQELVKGR